MLLGLWFFCIAANVHAFQLSTVSLKWYIIDVEQVILEQHTAEFQKDNQIYTKWHF